MIFIKRTLSLVMGLMLLTAGLYAQGQQMQTTQPDSITDKELKKFANTTGELQTIQQKTQKKVQSLVQDEGMEFERFRKIMMSKQNPQMAQNVEVTKEEEKAIQNIQPELMEVQRNAQQEFVKVIQDEGLTPQRFQQIVQAVQTDPEVSKRFQEIAGPPGSQN